MNDSVFYILNENGQVEKWCFTIGTSFDKVTTLFSEQHTIFSICIRPSICI